jgi:hypothetical protein
MTEKKKKKTQQPPPHIPRGQVQKGTVPRGQVTGQIQKGTVPKGQVPKDQVKKGTIPTGQIEIVTPPEEQGQRMCPACGDPMSYHGSVGSWYCQRCLTYF